MTSNIFSFGGHVRLPFFCLQILKKMYYIESNEHKKKGIYLKMLMSIFLLMCNFEHLFRVLDEIQDLEQS